MKITFEGDEDFSDDEYETYETIYNFDSSKVTIKEKPVAVTGVTIQESASLEKMMFASLERQKRRSM